eukprot:TRINITY_DN2582_c0_g1_i5.p1 TRINITY_DN2582_c0_g1~~TRINITY_DN2582_c0_g1_i5.p1  ORF type:complete len:399 (-),score=36.38 TRINITY_DN2582_c0_g1_i5:533-1729(-)
MKTTRRILRIKFARDEQHMYVRSNYPVFGYLIFYRYLVVHYLFVHQLNLGHILKYKWQGMTENSSRPKKIPRIKLPTFSEVEASEQDTEQFKESFQPPTNDQLSPGGNTTNMSNLQEQPIPRQSYPNNKVQAPASNTAQINSSAVGNSQIQVLSLNSNPGLVSSSLLINRNQEGNPILPFIRQVGKAFVDIIPDYQVGYGTAVLFLSLRFHKLRPTHIHVRIKQLARAYRTYLLCHVDVDDPHVPLMDVTKLAIDNNLTLICAFSPRECARYLETLKAYEHKPADAIKERLQEDHQSRVAAAFTMVKGVNRTDCATLGTKFGTVGDILKANVAQLTSCPGVGPAKAKRFYEAFNMPILRKKVEVQQFILQNCGEEIIEDPPSNLDEIEETDDDFEDPI